MDRESLIQRKKYFLEEIAKIDKYLVRKLYIVAASSAMINELRQYAVDNDVQDTYEVVYRTNPAEIPDYKNQLVLMIYQPTARIIDTLVKPEWKSTNLGILLMFDQSGSSLRETAITTAVEKSGGIRSVQSIHVTPDIRSGRNLYDTKITRKLLDRMFE